jgi:hypothetical protein
MLEVRDPADVRSVVGEVPSMTAAQVAAAYSRARAGFETWRRTGVLDRAAVLARCADLVRARVDDGATTVVRENDKTLAEARVEITKTADFLDYYASFARQPWGELLSDARPGTQTSMRVEPIGVVLAICPWNDPLITPARKLGPALIAGNAVLLKVASQTPLIATWVAGLLAEAGLPDGVLQVITGGEATPEIVPFRGEYLRLRPHAADRVHRLIYPVPDPRYPFLGVHLTPRVDGTSDLGPNAVLALAREGYRRTDVSVAQLSRLARSPAFWRLARQHWMTGVREYRGSFFRRAYLAEARTYLPWLALGDVTSAPAGVRAQAVGSDGGLLDDFRIQQVGDVTSVRNAPSPAATASMAIAEHIVAELKLPLGTER